MGESVQVAVIARYEYAIGAMPPAQSERARP